MWKIFNQLFLLKVWNVFIEFQNHKMHLQFDKNQGNEYDLPYILIGDKTFMFCSVVDFEIQQIQIFITFNIL